MIQDVSNYWNGEDDLRPGHIVSYVGGKVSQFYKLPDQGEVLTLLQEDIQMGFNAVWICRWYDGDGRINLVPLVAKVLGPVELPIDPRVQEVADQYTSATGEKINTRALQKALASFLPDNDNIVAQDVVGPVLEVTLRTDGGFSLKGVQFPVTMKLYPEDYKNPTEDSGLHIKGRILNMLPNLDGDSKLNDIEFYYFFSYEATYKEVK